MAIESVFLNCVLIQNPGTVSVSLSAREHQQSPGGRRLWQGVRWGVQGSALRLQEHRVDKHSSSFLAPSEHRTAVGTVQTILRGCRSCSCPAVSPLVGLYRHFLYAKQKMQTVGQHHPQECSVLVLKDFDFLSWKGFQVCLTLSTVIQMGKP